MSLKTQLNAKERIVELLDPHSFVEIGEGIHARSTDFNLKDQATPADGVLTGFGTIHGRLAYVYSQDRNVLGGSVGEMHAKKIVRIYEMAMKTGAPVIGMIDCAGMRLQEGTDALNAFGQLYRQQIKASGVIPQISIIFGKCGGGMALIPSFSDFTLAVEGNSHLFVHSPDVVTGNYKEKLDTSSAAYRYRTTGEIDLLVKDDKEAIERAVELFSLLPSNHCEEAVYMEGTSDDLNRENEEVAAMIDAGSILKKISDDEMFFELKPEYALDMVTGFISLNGMTIGAVANRGGESVLTVHGSKKAADFIRFCDAFSIPVLTLVNVIGFASDLSEEQQMAKEAAKLTEAYASADVPKVTVVTGHAFGSAYLCMGSRHVGADFVYSWPDAQIGMMNAESAVKIMYDREIEGSSDQPDFIREKAELYDRIQNSPESAASRGYVDSVIPAGSTRKRVIAAFEMLMTKRERIPDKKHTTI